MCDEAESAAALHAFGIGISFEYIEPVSSALELPDPNTCQHSLNKPLCAVDMSAPGEYFWVLPVNLTCHGYKWIRFKY